MRLLSRREMRKVKWATRKDWLLDDDHEYRLPILMLWCVMVLILAGQAFLWFNTPWSVMAKTGMSLITGGILIAVAVVISFMMQEDM